VLRISLCKAQGRKALSRSYGRFIAEFLNEESLVPLGLLALPTCVGLRYGFLALNLKWLFSEGASSEFARQKPSIPSGFTRAARF